MVVVGLAAVRFVAIQMLPMLDSGRPYARMPTIEVEDVPVQSARPAGDEAVELRVEDCTGVPVIEQVSESDTEVCVRVVAQVDGDSDACPATVHVQLRQPLGERDIIDVSTGRLVEQP